MDQRDPGISPEAREKLQALTMQDMELLAWPVLYTQVLSQSPCTRVRPRRSAQIMVIPLASAATPVWPVCKGSLRASRSAGDSL